MWCHNNMRNSSWLCLSFCSIFCGEFYGRLVRRHRRAIRDRSLLRMAICGMTTLVDVSGSVALLPTANHGCYIINRQLHKAITVIVQRYPCAAVFTHLMTSWCPVLPSGDRKSATSMLLPRRCFSLKTETHRQSKCVHVHVATVL